MAVKQTKTTPRKRRLRRSLQHKVRSVQRLLRLKPRRHYLILACPRSGTTAMRNWLNSQPEIAEVPQTRILIAASQFLTQCERFDGLAEHRGNLLKSLQRDIHSTYTHRTWIWRKAAVDKENLDPIGFPQPDYSTYLRHVRDLLPGIRILLMVRDPLSTIWSMRQRPWGTTLVDTTQLRHFTLQECIDVWLRASEFVLDAAAADDTYICLFENLVNNPNQESEQIAHFLQLGKWKPFEVRETKTIGFSDRDREQILAATTDCWNRLRSLRA